MVTESLTRNPVPRPLAEASARMSWRTDMVVEPLAPAPCPEIRFGVVMVTFATPAAEAAPAMPPITKEPWPLPELNVPIVKVRGLAAFGASSMRPPPLVTLKVVIVSVVGVAAVAEPLRVSLPPWIARVPVTSSPRRLLTLAVPELSSAMMPPALRLKVPPPEAAVPLKASPAST